MRNELFVLLLTWAVAILFLTPFHLLQVSHNLAAGLALFLVGLTTHKTKWKIGGGLI